MHNTYVGVDTLATPDWSVRWLLRTPPRGGPAGREQSWEFNPVLFERRA